VIEQQVPRHQDEAAFFREVAELLELGTAHRGRLLDEDVLAGLERASRELVVSRHGRRDHDRLDGVVRQEVIEGRRQARLRIALREALVLCLVDVAEPGEVGEVGEVAREVLAPLAEADLSQARHQSFHTFPLPAPFLPVALRRSTTICARSTRSS
jgi:hypothetical protein